VPAAEIAQAPPRRYAEQAPVAIYCGRLDASKNVDIVIRACAAVMAARDLVLYVCGSGRDRHTLEALARELGIAASVRFTGYVSDLWSYQRAADVALLLSAFEGDPNVVSECFAAGTPMILSDIPAHRELAGDALLVPQRDVTATAAAITRVLDDPAAARQRAERARARIGDGSLAAMVAAYEQVYAAIIGR
jgi:glycosyltransferase involved in cell wall biosynthesis